MPCQYCGAAYGHAPGCPYAAPVPPQPPAPPQPPQRSPAVVLAAVFGALIVLFALAAVAYAVVPKYLEDDPAPRVTASPLPAGITRENLVGVWTGDYSCSGKVRGLRLTVAPDGASMLEAEFIFYRDARTDGTPHGRYTMGGYFAGGRVTLQPGTWIDHPDDYVMVGLSGEVARTSDGGLTMTGTADICESFALRKLGE
ncbi:hypothetical protein GCM10022221_12950 [Actinocorallia aurea]